MIDISSLPALIPQLLPLIYDYLKIKGIIKVEGKTKEIVQQPEFRQKFLEDSDNNIIVIIEGDVYLGDFSKIPNNEKSKLLSDLKSNGEEKPIKDVNFFTFDFYQRVLNFSVTEIIDKDLNEYLKYIKSADILNLFYLSRYVKILFDQGNSTEANNIKSDIGNHYGKIGRKFCNLYLQGYIHIWIDYLTTEYDYETETTEFEKIFESEIRHFVEYADTIFFIHQHSDKKQIILKCTISIDKLVSYIALHAGGKSNIETTNEILSKIKKCAIENEYTIKIENRESKTKTPLLNVYITRHLN